MRDLGAPERLVLGLFAAFILLCGFTHAINVYSTFSDTWRGLAYVKIVTALISLITAATIVFIVPGKRLRSCAAFSPRSPIIECFLCFDARAVSCHSSFVSPICYYDCVFCVVVVRKQSLNMSPFRRPNGSEAQV